MNLISSIVHFEFGLPLGDPHIQDTSQVPTLDTFVECLVVIWRFQSLSDADPCVI